MREILLSQGKSATVDDDDYKSLIKHKWYAARYYNLYYAVRTVWDNGNGRRGFILMHREILGLAPGDGKIVDHMNRNSLDNRRNNLRLVTHSANMYNSKMQTNNTSGYRGICWHKTQKKWNVQIRVHGTRKYCGCFTEITEAISAYNTAAIEYWGKDAILNFHKEDI